MKKSINTTDSGGRILSVPAQRDLLLLGLVWSAGFVDAAGYLGLGRVFTANMTGNAVLLATALSRGADLAALRSFAALVGFILGVLTGAYIAMGDYNKEVWPGPVNKVLLLELVAIIALALCWSHVDALTSSDVLAGLIVLSGFAMGLQSAAVRRLDVSAFGSTAITGTLIGVISGLVAWLQLPFRRSEAEQQYARESRTALNLSFTVWTVYLLGALIGGETEERWHAEAIWLPAGALAVVIVVSAVRLRRVQEMSSLPSSGP
jgi:uncharacterized membrane protein YoaK (UPF0700 family)